MKALLSIDHPAWAHQFRHIVAAVNARGGQVMTLAVEKDGDTELLRQYGIPYVLSARSTGKNIVEKGLLFLGLCVEHSWRALRFRPDVLIGRASPMMAVAAWVSRRPHLVFEDTEVSKFSLRICRRLSTRILTPRTFLTDLGPRQVRLDTYKELFYLHPSVFTPDRQALRDCGFDPDEPYVLVRFVAWNASHDIGRRGLDDAGKVALVRRLEAYARVYVSAEGELPAQLEANRLRTPFHMAHHVLAFARLVFSEGATMASEAAVLGTHALYVNTIVSGTTREQSERYGLLYNFNEGGDRYERAAAQAEALLRQSDLEQQGQAKREKLLAEKVDINQYYLDEMDRLAKAGRKRA
ncbi:MAG TPA: hypothetical protein IAC48_09635 [Candidatus Limiplasma stercoravium]|nr:hypothetical protein [Candidatus Limiplasma stercoravium]